MSTLEKLDLPWEVITLIGLDKISPDNMHLYNAVLYGLAERYKLHGFEWVKEHAQEIRTQICAASCYAGNNICDNIEGCEDWIKACAAASRLLNAPDSDDTAEEDSALGTDDSDVADSSPKPHD